MNDKIQKLGVARVISGGQTGVDRGALEAAMSLGLEHGGWCPRGRLAEDGIIPSKYRLDECPSSEYWVRTEQNVIDSDGTLILFHTKLSGGTLFTHRMTKKNHKPSLLVDLDRRLDPQSAVQWIERHGVRVLNVAGPRESSHPGIAARAKTFVESIFQSGTGTHVCS